MSHSDNVYTMNAFVHAHTFNLSKYSEDFNALVLGVYRKIKEV